MPDKQTENKLMAMLERRGLIRKVEAEADSPDEGSASSKDSTRSEIDLSTLFGTAANETVKVTPASRQPVPGISTPILAGERSQNTVREEPQQMGSIVMELSEPAKPQTDDSQAAQLNAEIPETPDSLLEEPQVSQSMLDQPTASTVSEETVEDSTLEQKEDSESLIREESKMEESQSTEPEEAEEDAISLSFPGGCEVFSNDISRSESEPSQQRTNSTEYQQRSPAEDFTDKYIDISDLYEILALKSKRTETIYLVEEYLKSLPDSLPIESRRDIVGKIVTASGFDYDLLMGDGVLRVKMLKDYAERFASRTDEYVASRQAELEELDQQISRVRKLIENRRELHKKQFYAIEAEAQRLKEILEFLGG